MRFNRLLASRQLSGQAGLLVAVLTLLARPAAANELPSDFAWVFGTGGTNPVSLYGIATDTNSGVYFTGRFNGQANFGTNKVVTVSGLDMVVAKLDANGNWLWVRHAGETNPGAHPIVWGGAVAVDSQGAVLVAGSAESYYTNIPAVISFGATNVALNQGGLNNEVFVAKYDADGACLWARNVGGLAIANILRATTDRSNNLYVCGVFSPGNTNSFVLLKLDPDGNELYRLQPVSGSLLALGVRADTQGNAYICGRLDSTTVFNGLTLTNPAGTKNVFVARLDTTGNPEWGVSSAISGAYPFAFSYGLALDSQSNVLVAGTAGGTNFFGFPISQAGGQYDIAPFVLKLTPGGQPIWLRSAVSTHPGYQNGFNDVAVDAVDNIYVTGQLEYAADFGGTILSAAGIDDVLVAKYSADGQICWALRAGGTNNAQSQALVEYGLSTACGPAGLVVLGSFGDYYSSGNYIAGFGSHSVSNAGNFASSFVGLIPYPIPQLDIGAAGHNLLLSWPTFPPGYFLEKANLLDTPTLWTSNPSIPSLINGTNVLSLPMTGDRQFFRLRKP